MLVGCGSQPLQRPEALPNLASLDSHNTSLTASDTRMGVEFFQGSSGNWELTPALQVRSEAGGSAWAIYQLDPPPGLTAQSVTVDDSGVTDEGWIGLANFTEGSWQFNGPYGYGKQTFDLTSGDYLSAGGHVYVAIVSYNGRSAVIHSVTLKAGNNVASWKIVTVDAAEAVGGYSSLAIVNGKPAISYTDFSFQHPKYAYSSSLDGTAGWTAVTTDTAVNGGLWTSLELVSGKPAMSYSDANSGRLKYAYSSSLDGSAGWTALIVDTPPNAGYATSLALVNGKPAITYYAGEQGGLKYAYSSSANGSGGWIAITVDNTGDVGYSPSLVVVNNRPGICYCDRTTGELKYAHSSTANGASGWSTVVVDSGLGVGYDVGIASQAVINGKPSISYYDEPAASLKYAYSSTPNGASGWTTLVVDSAGDVGQFSSLAVIGGNPSISYYDSTNMALKYAQSSTADGAASWTVEVVEDTGIESRYTSLAEVNGKPAISYLDATNWDLKYAVRLQ
jgi:hypothetical protein